MQLDAMISVDYSSFKVCPQSATLSIRGPVKYVLHFDLVLFAGEQFLLNIHKK